MERLKVSDRGAFLQRMFLVAALWVAVIVSSLALVYSTFDSRVKFNELENLRREQNRLRVEWGQYLLEESTWAEYGRVEKLANEKLDMKVPDMENIILLPSKEQSELGAGSEG
jgi:cell division protein FtsL